MVFGKHSAKMVNEKILRDILKGIVDESMIGSIQVTDKQQVVVTLEVDPAQARNLEETRQKAEAALSTVVDARQVMVILTAERQAKPVRKPAPSHIDVPGVRHIIAVASGKGGVGKSTVAANLAAGFARLGLKAGLLDADIYGPSVPRLMGMAREKPEQIDGPRLRPLMAHGLKIMSMGFLVDEATPMIWRGPMVQSALQQLLRDVAWNDGGDLDVLVIDMPPGTGDAQLTLVQKVKLTGAVIVSTPQDIALIDARKGLEMFRKVSVPILGIIENMSYYCCPSCGARSDIFGHGGARMEAQRIGEAFLGEVPLHAEIRSYSDQGIPVVVAEPDSHQAQAFMDIARQVQENLVPSRQAVPRIIIEE